MYTYLKERKYYEDRYDRFTVGLGRRGRYHYQKFLKEFTEKMKQTDPPEDPTRPANVILGKLFYMQALGCDLLERYENRDQEINEDMERDRARDQRIAKTKLKHEPPCQHCGKLKLECFDKILMHRDGGDKELVLLTLRCADCHGYSAYWEDGAPFRPNHSDDEPMVEEAPKETKPKYRDYHNLDDPYYWNIDPENDPDYAKDRYDFCLYDETKLQHLRDMRDGFQRMSELGKYLAEQDQQRAVNWAVEQIKKLSAAELINIITAATEKKHYTNLNFSAPEIGRHLIMEFSCLDSKPERKEYQSCRTLKHLIDKELLLTNWRLMSDGLQYRLGVLSGRLKAVENPDEIRKLAEKLIKTGKIKPSKEPETKNSGKVDSYITSDGTVVKL